MNIACGLCNQTEDVGRVMLRKRGAWPLQSTFQDWLVVKMAVPIVWKNDEIMLVIEIVSFENDCLTVLDL